MREGIGFVRSQAKPEFEASDAVQYLLIKARIVIKLQPAIMPATACSPGHNNAENNAANLQVALVQLPKVLYPTYCYYCC